MENKKKTKSRMETEFKTDGKSEWFYLYFSLYPSLSEIFSLEIMAMTGEEKWRVKESNLI